MVILKSRPEDFVVEEVIEISHKKNNCLAFTLKKRNENTVGAIKKIARALGIPFKNFGYAGLKDKHAVTKQKVSVKNAKKKDLCSITLKNIEITDIERGDEIGVGDHRGNNFRIIVRDVNEVREIGEGFPNLFGEQRLGGNEDVGREMLRGDFESAVKTLLSREGMEKQIEKEEFDKLLTTYPNIYEKNALRSLIHKKNYLKALKTIPSHVLRLYVHAYQSYIFNKLLKMRLERLDLRKIEQGDIICTDKFEKKAYVPVNASNVEQVQRTESRPVLPIIGYKTRIYRNTKKDLELLLKKEKVTLKDFKMKSLPFLSSRGTYRELIGRYEDLSWELKDRTLFCEFFLPKGEYATVFIDYLLLS
ncbi:MAG: tRNA pseudouridine(13) synthase TruD [Euryarchaeota archaeon]|nr:tRNA pseudouridine(13) synthase TruD [Euryarchaeota archaeon]